MIAADTGYMRGTTTCEGATKIIRRKDGWLAGVTGDFALQGPLFAWFMTGGEGDIPSLDPDPDACNTALIISPDGSVRVHERGGFYILQQPVYFAIGSGCGVALGAMYAGVDAERAVAAAIAHDGGTNGRVVLLRA